MKYFCFLIILYYSLPCVGKIFPPLLPQPQKIVYTHEKLILDQIYLENTENLQEWCAWLHETNTTVTSIPAPKTIKINILPQLPEIPLNSQEGYKIKITNNQIHISATSSTGTYRALQTIRQLTCKDKDIYYLPTCEITDWPAFRIRGFMHDVGRTYISLKELKKEIELLSRFKINVFHWHLTENQAWRLESKLYPELNSPQNMKI